MAPPSRACFAFKDNNGYDLNTYLRDMVEPSGSSTINPIRRLLWPVQARLSGASHVEDECAHAEGDYDFQRADAYRTRYGLESAGTFIVLVRGDGQRAAVFDLTDQPPATLNRVFHAFFSLMNDDAIWDADFYASEAWRHPFEQDLEGRPLRITAHLIEQPVQP